MTKPPQPSSLSQNYLALARGMRELHQLAWQGKEDSPEADAVRDTTDAPWALLAPAERKRVGLMSEDLYSLVEPPPPAEPMNTQAQAKFKEAIEAKQAGDWDCALDLLRRWRAYIDPALVSCLRGEIWLDAGDPATASLFFEYASKLNPFNETIQAAYLMSLERADLSAAKDRANEILDNPNESRPVIVVHAAKIAFKSARTSSGMETGPVFQRLEPILTMALSKLEEPGPNSNTVRHSYRVLALSILGFGNAHLGDPHAALDFFSQALEISPHNAALLAARGALLYGTSPNAVADLELAILNGSTLIWPYTLLAHHYLMDGSFDACRKMCERALGMEAPPGILSEVAEWLAIAQAELRFPAELVRASFEIALHYDPTNERARRNLAVYESASSPVSMDQWETRTASSLQASSFAELRYPQVA